MIDFAKHKKGDVVTGHCCDSCARSAGLTPRFPPDSGRRPLFCEVCGHFGIGSRVPILIDTWLTLWPQVIKRDSSRLGE